MNIVISESTRMSRKITRMPEDRSPTAPERSADARQGVQSVEVGAHVLGALAAAATPMALGAVADATGMAGAKAHRYLVSLIRTGMVEQEPATGHYRLGPAAVEIGLAALGGMDAVRLGGEILPALRDDLDETVLLSVWGNKGPVVVRWEESRRPVTTNIRPGSVMPLLNSATGRAFAAFLPEEQTASLLAEETAIAPEEITGAFRKALTEARKHGMGRIRGDLLPGIASLAAPVFDHQARLACVIATLGPERSFDVSWDGPVAKRLRQAADALSWRLGFQRP